jgi:hypothetical protein
MTTYRSKLAGRFRMFHASVLKNIADFHQHVFISDNFIVRGMQGDENYVLSFPIFPPIIALLGRLAGNTAYSGCDLNGSPDDAPAILTIERRTHGASGDHAHSYGR